MEKNFKEVIRDIQEGEVWKCRQEGHIVDRVTLLSGNIIIDSSELSEFLTIRSDATFKLRRKQYTFAEAFEEYYQGIEIESVASGDKFKRDEGVGYSQSKDGKHWFRYGKFSVGEIRGGWYINK